MKEYYQNLLHSIPDIVYEIDKNGIIQYTNESIELTGYTPDELIGNHFSKIIHPDDLKLVQRSFVLEKIKGKKLKDKSPRLFDERRTGSRITKNLKIKLLHKKNSDDVEKVFEVEVIATGFFNNDKKFIGTVGIIRDISAIQKAERAVIQAEKHYRLLMENSSEIISILSNDGTILYKSNSIEKNLGYKSFDMIGENEIDFIHLDDKEKFKNYLQNLNHDTGSYFELRYHHDDHSYVFLETSINSIIDSNNNKMCYILNSRNITDRKKMEDEKLKMLEEIKEAKKTADKANLAKSQFLTKMSHEIRTPMNAIIGLTDLLLTMKIESEQKIYLDLVKESSIHLLNLINDILDFSKIESDIMNTRNVIFNLYETIGNTIALFSINANQKKIDLKYTIADNIAKIYKGDQKKIIQILINLLGNALKFTEKGSVKLDVDYIEDKKKKNNNDIVIIQFKVIDTGIGIPEELIDEIFNEFHQVDSSTTREFGGTGLGLSISKNLVKFMHGSISVESKLNKGSIFTFSIPLKKYENDTIQKKKNKNISNKSIKAEESNFDYSKYKILVTEDNNINRILFLSLLNKKGYNVQTAINGKEALEKLAIENFDLILMDIEMPEMDGVETTSIIRNKLKNDIPIIVLTAHALKGDRERFMEQGFNDYISKPIDIESFYAKIFKLIKKNNFNKK